MILSPGCSGLFKVRISSPFSLSLTFFRPPKYTGYLFIFEGIRYSSQLGLYYCICLPSARGCN